jgi:hypothetical protein
MKQAVIPRSGQQPLNVKIYMSEPEVRGIDLFKIAGESISAMSSLRNESELSSRKREAGGSDKRFSTQHFRSNLQPIYQVYLGSKSLLSAKVGKAHAYSLVRPSLASHSAS